MAIRGLSRYGGLWDPWNEMERVQEEMNKLFSRYSTRTAPDFPAVNIWTSEEEATVTTEIPGVNAEDVDISVVGKTLTLRGTRKSEELEEGAKYHRRERGYGDFVRTIELPYRVSPEKVEAKFSKGILHITLPRAEEDKPKKITVKAA
jgi:HSP20 family protein